MKDYGKEIAFWLERIYILAATTLVIVGVCLLFGLSTYSFGAIAGPAVFSVITTGFKYQEVKKAEDSQEIPEEGDEKLA